MFLDAASSNKLPKYLIIPHPQGGLQSLHRQYYVHALYSDHHTPRNKITF